jgi:DNA end-binding protein Ku
MAARAIWSGAVSFGLVTIPVKLYTATRARDIQFHLLHAKDGSRISQKRFCQAEDVEIPWNEVVKGYEVAPGEHVVLTDEDFKALPLPSLHTVAIEQFVEAHEIDPVYFETSYRLAPEARAEKSYALLYAALERRHLVAVARIALRKREQLCVVRAKDGVLLLDTLFYQDEVEVTKEPATDRPVAAKELELADTLIDLLKKPFDPAEYTDTYREALESLIEAKQAGVTVTSGKAGTKKEPTVLDLTAKLRESVAAARGRAEPAGRRAPARSKSPRSAEKKTAARRRDRNRKAS